MNYEFSYRLASAPEARVDGTGQVVHDLWAMYREEGEMNGWAPVGGYYRGVPIPTNELKAVMDMPHGTGVERQAKNQAYKGLLAAHIGDGVVTWTGGWSKAELEQYMDINDACILEAQRANEYITVTLERDYPIEFNL